MLSKHAGEWIENLWDVTELRYMCTNSKFKILDLIQNMWRDSEQLNPNEVVSENRAINIC